VECVTTVQAVSTRATDQRYYSAPDRERGVLWWACLSVCVCMCVCVCVCVFVCPRSYLWNYTSDLHQFFEHVTYAHGSVLFWRRSDKLRISGFVDDVIFAHKLIGCSTSPPGWGSEAHTYAALGLARRNTPCRQRMLGTLLAVRVSVKPVRNMIDLSVYQRNYQMIWMYLEYWQHLNNWRNNTYSSRKLHFLLLLSNKSNDIQ